MKTKCLVAICVLSLAATAAAQTPTASPVANPTPTPSPTATPWAGVQVELETVNPATISQAASATTGAMTIALTGSIFTITPTGPVTFNSTGTSRAGRFVTFVVTTAGASSFVLTWGTNFKAAGTLATGTVAAKKFAVTFRCLDGTTWIEVARTAAM